MANKLGDRQESVPIAVEIFTAVGTLAETFTFTGPRAYHPNGILEVAYRDTNNVWVDYPPARYAIQTGGVAVRFAAGFKVAAGTLIRIVYLTPESFGKLKVGTSGGSITYPAASVAEADIYESSVPATNRSISFSGWLIDLTNCTTAKTLRIYFKVDGTNYRLQEAMLWRVGDNPAVLINSFSTAVQVRITIQSSVVEAAPRVIPIAYVMEG